MGTKQSKAVGRPDSGKFALTAAVAAGLTLVAGFLAFRYESLLIASAAGFAAAFLVHHVVVRKPPDWTPEFEAALGAAGTGQFHLRLPAEGPVPQPLVQAFNGMQLAMEGRQAGIDALSGQMGVMAGRLVEHAQQALAQAGVDADAIQSAVTELTESVEEVASSSVQAAESSRQANKGADEGKVAMTEALGSMDLLSGELGNARQAMQQLDVHIESIGGVLDVIRGIAEQTNMLALNAAIEAARAGEQGRGFVVVADEVRNLAGRTQQSTQEIQKMIERVQNGARKVVDVVVEGDNQAKVCEELIETACVSLAEISGEIASINTLNTQIDQLTAGQHEVVTRLGRQMVDAVEERRQSLEQSGLTEMARQIGELSGNLG
jgi:methyl-accepting chemotaxis protein